MTELVLTGLMGTPDTFDRLRLCLVDILPSRETSGILDSSYARLRKAVPQRAEYKVPYTLPLNGAPDDAGIRGECWIAVPGSDSRRKQRILDLAYSLVGKEVELTVKTKRYSFASQAQHNYGTQVSGTSLSLVTLRPLADE